jgi:hypothetical protein
VIQASEQETKQRLSNKQQSTTCYDTKKELIEEQPRTTFKHQSSALTMEDLLGIASPWTTRMMLSNIHVVDNHP